MCSVKLVSSIKSSSRISLPINKKTPKARDAYATGLSRQFQNLLLNGNEKINIRDYKNYIFKIVKTKDLSLKFNNLETSDINSSIKPDIKLYRWKERPNDYYAEYVGYLIETPKRNGMIDCSQSTLVHETRHLFDMLCNPKYKMARQYKDFDNAELMHKYLEIKRFIAAPDLYRPKYILGIKISTFENQLRKKLENLKNTEVIDILQISRYHLKSEKNAYSDAINFELKKHPFSLELLLAYLKKKSCIKNSFHFSEKERVVNKLIKEYVAKERFNFRLSSVLLGKNRQ